MAERLTDEQMELLAADVTRLSDRWVRDRVLGLLAEVRERRAAEKDDDDALAELNAIGEMSEEECNRELEAAGVDTALWASSTMALVKACKERNAAMARIAELEACLRECVDEDKGIEMLMILCAFGQQTERERASLREAKTGMIARARAALAKGGSK